MPFHMGEDSRLAPIALTIAGSDSGGGAGIQADLKTFHHLGVFGTSVITAITAQNTLGVTRWSPVDPTLVRAQLDAVTTDLPPRAIKSGMLATSAIILAIADRLPKVPYVLDPVLVSSSGSPLVEPDAITTLCTHLLPLATLITPNLDEAAILVGYPVHDIPSMEHAARTLVASGAKAALVKGGHLPTPVDVLFDGTAGIRHFPHRHLDSRDTHGTGCALSAAVTARLALGDNLDTAVATAADFVHRAIATAPGLGGGTGPLNFWA
jgi:hydroxymethylpyrimidine/phosphomethylpyrimidine kinase